MKNIKLNSKKLFVILLSGFIIMTSVGCSKNKNEVENSNSNNRYTVENSSVVEEQQSTTNESTSSKKSAVVDDQSKVDGSIQNETSSTTKTEKFTTEDQEVIVYFNELKENVDEVLNSETSESIKDSLKGTFITVVDFVFYEGEIKGIKFDDLTEGAKENILETATTIDNAIMTKFPNYKEEINSTVSVAYNKASELIKKGANNVKEFSKEKLGEENYNAIIDAKDELVYYTKNAFDIVGDVAITIWDKGTEKVKNWYETFKNN